MAANRLLRLILLFALTVVGAPAARAEPKFSFASTPGQLPRDVLPEHYAITLTPDTKTLAFSGSEVVDIKVVKPTRNVVINALDLQIVSAAIGPDRAKVRIDKDQQTATLRFARPLPVGAHKLAIAFSGKISNRPEGLFYTRYQTDRGEKTMLGTQMEPTDARRMFPGWDEPVYRTSYQLTVNVPEAFLAVSNTPIQREQKLGSGRKSVTFARTPRMSSYLVVLCAGELEALSDEVAGVQIRVVTTEGKKAQGRYALDVLKQIIPYYNDYFGVKYPLPKLDMIAIPGGFGGAMENWGGITYNERILLFDPERSSQQTREAIYSVVAHEVAHQWFGDLVTMAWWDNLWLNEGFASWMQNKVTDYFNPGWQVWVRANAEKEGAMDSDARKTAHPIQQPAKTPTDAMSAFDEITYLKGQSVIRMFETYTGEDAFRTGIRRYMAAHQYSSTTTEDLWEALEQASGQPVKTVATGWTEQPGFPVVKVSACADTKPALALRQERFTLNDPKARPLFWQVPVSFMQPGTGVASKTFLLTGKAGEVDVARCDAPTKLNAGDTGYYRVQYDRADFEKLQKVFADLPASDRVNLLADTWALVQAGRVGSREYLSLAESARNDLSLPIWEQVTAALASIDRLQIDQPGREAFQAYGRSLLRPTYERLGWEEKPGEASTDAVLRSRVISLLGDFKDQEVVTEARRRFASYLTSPRSLAPNLRPAVLGIVGHYADQAAYDQLHALGRKTQSTEEKNLFYGAMASALNPKLARQTLALTLTDELEPGQASNLVLAVAVDGEHRELAWNFTKQNLKPLLAKRAAFSRRNYVPNIASVFTDTGHADELEAFAKANLPADARSEVLKGSERIRFRADLKARELTNIDSWACSRTQTAGQRAQFCLGVN